MPFKSAEPLKGAFDLTVGHRQVGVALVKRHEHFSKARRHRNDCLAAGWDLRIPKVGHASITPVFFGELKTAAAHVDPKLAIWTSLPAPVKIGGVAELDANTPPSSIRHPAPECPDPHRSPVVWRSSESSVSSRKPSFASPEKGKIPTF